MPAEKVESPPPIVLALIAADNGHRDSATGKYFILGTIAALAALSFPCALSIFCIYAALTDGRGETSLNFRLVDVDEEREPLLLLHAEVDFPNPIHVAEIMFIVNGLTFPEPGEYRLQIRLEDDTILCERRLLASQTQPPLAAGEPTDEPGE